jgi:hypothetical protein
MENGIGEVKGDQDVAWRCYNTTLKDPASRETLTVEGVELKRAGYKERGTCRRIGKNFYR